MTIGLHTGRKYLVADWLTVSMTLTSYTDITSQQDDSQAYITSEQIEDNVATRKLIKNVEDQELLWIDHADYDKRGPRFHAWRKISSAMQKGDFC